MMTPKEALWKRYYDAVRKGKKQEAAMLLNQIHTGPTTQPKRGGCSRCRKRF